MSIAFISITIELTYFRFLEDLKLSSDGRLRTHKVEQGGQTDDPQATSGPRPLVTRPAKLFVNLLLVTISSFVFFTPKDVKKIVILISSAALRTSATHATDFKTLPQNVSFPGKNVVRYKLLQEKI
jgi:hypothetical protein